MATNCRPSFSLNRISILSLVFHCACNQCENQARQGLEVDVVDDEIYSALFDSWEGVNITYSQETPLEVVDTTVVLSVKDDDKEYILGDLPNLEMKVLDELIERNGNAQEVPDDIDTKNPYVLIPEPDYYETEFARVSRPGVNGCNTQSIVYWTYFCGSQCGWGKYQQLDWDGMSWTLTDDSTDWVAR